MDKEIWKAVEGYEGYYEVSNTGRVRSLDRTVLNINGEERTYKGRVRRTNLVGNGYPSLILSKDGFYNRFLVHQLVAMAFLEHIPDGWSLVVDHKNGIKTDNRASNLRVVSQRWNSSMGFRKDRHSLISKYAGVAKSKNKKKWVARIVYNGDKLYLGSFDSEVEAGGAYMKAANEIDSGEFTKPDHKDGTSSKYVGVQYEKERNIWRARIGMNSKDYYVGSFPTEELAYKARLKAESEISNGTFLQLREQGNKNK